MGTKNDAADIKDHIFFKDINWDDVEKKVKDGPYLEKDKTDRLLKEIQDV